MLKKVNIKIVLTGGHAATTAYSVANELRNSRGQYSYKIFWIGAAHAVEGKNVPTLESSIFSKANIQSYQIIAGRLQRKFTIWSLVSLLKIPIGFGHAAAILSKIKPDIILSFGGYAAFPVCVVGRVFGIPIVIHDQTTSVGRANKASFPFARKILLARSGSIAKFDATKMAIVGNPLMPNIAQVKPKLKLASIPTIFIFCGSRGSQAVNTIVGQVICELVEKYHVIHQTGSLDYAKVASARDRLSDRVKGRYTLYSTIDPFEVYKFYRDSDLIISRAGANTVSEILAVKRPAILIPLPIAYNDEQMKNAKYAERFGVATILEQKGLSKETLLATIAKVVGSWKETVNTIAKKPSPDGDSAKKVVDCLEEVLKSK